VNNAEWNDCAECEVMDEQDGMTAECEVMGEQDGMNVQSECDMMSAQYRMIGMFLAGPHQ